MIRSGFCTRVYVGLKFSIRKQVIFDGIRIPDDIVVVLHTYTL